MNKQVIGRWYVVVEGDTVRIYDTKHIGNFWISVRNPLGFQPTGAIYTVRTFLEAGADTLMLNGDVEEWTMNANELYNAQLFVYSSQNVDMKTHVNTIIR
jgi:hypothetical protein